MKRNLILSTAAMMLMGAAAMAAEKTLIDFTLLDANEEGVNERTAMDYSVTAGTTFTDEQKGQMKTSLALPEWEVVLNSSAQNVQSVALSQVVAAPVKADAKVAFAGKNVMGVRVLFPTLAANANAQIVPAFDIPAYAKIEDEGASISNEDSTRFEGGYGVVKNVGTIKAIAITTYGMNFPHGVYVMLKDTDGVQRRYFMGYVNFDGWKQLTWNNPDYVSEIRTREIRIYPIYPRGLPFVKFAGLQITRDAANDGGDYIGYFGDVKIIYDKALLTTDRDIADEDLWGIITKKENARQNAEMSRFGEKQVYRYLEKGKKATEEAFTNSITGEAAPAQE